MPVASNKVPRTFLRGFVPELLRWFEQNRRDLPWRRTRDPWAIWVSEIMLQQTRVEAVRGAYSRFMARFPTPAAFAAADDAALLQAWQGLGYYRRARLLREAARAVTSQHAGAVPADPALLGALPGIGAYTRGAVASIAFGVPECAIDGNVERVVARHRGIEADVKSAAGRTAIRALVASWLDRTRPGDFNQAMMELGALVCTPRAPRCDVCPVARDCVARKRGLVDRLPLLPARKPAIAIVARCALIHGRGRSVLGRRIASGRINGGQVDLAGPGALTHLDSAAELATSLGQRVRIGELLATVRHTITQHRIELLIHAGELVGRRARDEVFAAPDAPEVPWSTLARKAFRACGL